MTTPPSERRNGRLAVEGMRSVHDHAGVDRLLAGLFGIQRGHVWARRHGRRAATARDCADARRGRVDVETASHLERLHELAQAVLVSGFHDHVHRVLAVHDGFALDLQAELPDIRATQVIEKTGTHQRVLRRTAVGRMLMSHDEKGHGWDPTRAT